MTIWILDAFCPLQFPRFICMHAYILFLNFRNVSGQAVPWIETISKEEKKKKKRIMMIIITTKEFMSRLMSMFGCYRSWMVLSCASSFPHWTREKRRKKEGKKKCCEWIYACLDKIIQMNRFTKQGMARLRRASSHIFRTLHSFTCRWRSRIWCKKHRR